MCNWEGGIKKEVWRHDACWRGTRDFGCRLSLNLSFSTVVKDHLSECKFSVLNKSELVIYSPWHCLGPNNSTETDPLPPPHPLFDKRTGTKCRLSSHFLLSVESLSCGGRGGIDVLLRSPVIQE